MDLPATGFAVATFFVLALPGLSYGYADAALRGFRADDKSVDTRIVRSLVVSAIFVAIYLVAFSWSDTLDDEPLVVVAQHSVEIARPAATGMLILLLFILIPAATAALGHWLRKATARSDHKWLQRLRQLTPYRSTPTAWDAGAVRNEAVYVRVRMGDGQWVGGLFADDSYVSTYPEPRDIYIQYQHQIGDDGKLGARMESSAGVWVSITDECIVEWLTAEFE